MKERYFVAYDNKEKPELEGIYWCKTKAEAVSYAQEWKEKYPKDAQYVILAKILNVPSLHKESIKERQ